MIERLPNNRFIIKGEAGSVASDSGTADQVAVTVWQTGFGDVTDFTDRVAVGGSVAASARAAADGSFAVETVGVASRNLVISTVPRADEGSVSVLPWAEGKPSSAVVDLVGAAVKATPLARADALAKAAEAATGLKLFGDPLPFDMTGGPALKSGAIPHVINDRLFVWNNSGEGLSPALFDPATGRWATLEAASLKTGGGLRSVSMGPRVLILPTSSEHYLFYQNTSAPLQIPLLEFRDGPYWLWSRQHVQVGASNSAALIWGGYNQNATGPVAGVLFDSTTQTLKAVSMANAPTPTTSGVVVGMGEKFFVYGGYSAGVGAVPEDGGIYDPETDTWSPISKVGMPLTLPQKSGIATGSKVVVVGQTYVGEIPTVSGFLYDSAADRWEPTINSGVVQATLDSTQPLLTSSSHVFVCPGTTDEIGVVRIPVLEIATKTWRHYELRHSSIVRFAQLRCQLLGGLLYVFGGALVSQFSFALPIESSK